uniref:Uncharacterized protein n=1 Tax=Chinchilla lanigera TaxID=34839 RepID=A0A8C2YPA1_CHILA
MDPSSDYHFLNQILWQRVKLTLVSGIFEGVLQHVDPNKIVVLKKVADVFQFSMETGGFLPNCISTLQESLIRHLDVAPKYLSFLEDRQKLIKENPEVWFTRPLPPSLLKMLALEATYLLPLRTALLDEMMSDLTTLVGGYLNTCRGGSADQLVGTEPTCMELPEELLQLKDFQKQRRERAAKEYRMNAQGLLIRTVLHPKKSDTATAGKGKKVRGFFFCKDPREEKPPSLTSHEFHEDGNFLKGEFKTTVKSEHLPPIKKGETSEGSSSRLICPESKRSEDGRITQKEYFMLPKHEFQASFSVKEELLQLLILKDKEYLLSTKPDVSVSPFLLQETRVSPNDTFHPFKDAGISTLPPCPALEKIDWWINPSLNLF